MLSAGCLVRVLVFGVGCLVLGIEFLVRVFGIGCLVRVLG